MPSIPQPPSTSTSSITTTPLSVFTFSVSFDHQEHLRQRLSQASRSIKRSSSSCHSSRFRRSRKSGQENQESEAGIIESVQGNPDSVAHDQQHPPPPQNQESTSQWRSWVRSCFSVSVSLSSLSWRRRQDQGRNQENHEEINQRLSHLYLRVSRVMSYVLFYSFFCGFVFVVQFSSSVKSTICQRSQVLSPLSLKPS